jgi:hypothetical protein
LFNSHAQATHVSTKGQLRSGRAKPPPFPETSP